MDFSNASHESTRAGKQAQTASEAPLTGDQHIPSSTSSVTGDKDTKETVLIKREPLAPKQMPAIELQQPLDRRKLSIALNHHTMQDADSAASATMDCKVTVDDKTQKINIQELKKHYYTPTEDERSRRKSTLRETSLSPHVELKDRSHVPERPHVSVMETNKSLKASLEAASHDSYDLKEMMARGAEALLYRATSGAFTYCSKSIRNNWAKFLGGNRATAAEKLENVKYSTKVRHIQNEFAIAQKINQDPRADIPTVRIYALRKVRRFGVEVGYDLIMEYLNGHDLGDKVLSRVLPMEDKIRVLYRAAKALDFLHRKKIIHLDIKPSNFMLVADKVKLIDFGVSVISGYKACAITGTGGYLSPEQICKDTIDERTDIFAFGVAFTVFFGGKPLVQPQEQLMTKQAKKDAKFQMENEETPAVTEIPALLDYPDVAEAIRECTIPKRDARTKSCAAFMARIKTCAEHHHIDLE